MFAATPAYEAYQARQAKGLVNPGSNYYFNARGQREKYLQGAGDQWYFVLPAGTLYQWGGTFAASSRYASSRPMPFAAAT